MESSTTMSPEGGQPMTAFRGINLPPTLAIRYVNTLTDLVTTLGNQTILGHTGHAFLGSAFIQGGRLQFTTSMPMHVMLQVSEMDRAKKKASVIEVESHANRPKENAHAKDVNVYLRETACVGEKFILPSFTFNLGVKADETQVDDATLVIFQPEHQADGANTWPAVLIIPRSVKLDTTDGAHRRGEIEGIATKEAGTSLVDNLFQNAVAVTVVFESSRADSHQDFADCGKAKAISRSMVATFDIRDVRNKATVDLVKKVPFLTRYVDATASGVNLSPQSRLIWSMSSVRAFVGHTTEVLGLDAGLEALRTSGPSFWDSCIKNIPTLIALDNPNANPPKPQESDTTTADLRTPKGGNILMRAGGLFILARAFEHCIKTGMPFDQMAKALGQLDWYILAKEDDAPMPSDTYTVDLFKVANPLWHSLLVVKDNRFRTSSTMADISTAWSRILAHAKIPELPEVPAAAE